MIFIKDIDNQAINPNSWRGYRFDKPLEEHAVVDQILDLAEQLVAIGEDLTISRAAQLKKANFDGRWCTPMVATISERDTSSVSTLMPTGPEGNAFAGYIGTLLVQLERSHHQYLPSDWQLNVASLTGLSHRRGLHHQ
jgi:hypothetical protein